MVYCSFRILCNKCRNFHRAIDFCSYFRNEIVKSFAYYTISFDRETAFSFRIHYKIVSSRLLRQLAMEVMLQERPFHSLTGLSNIIARCQNETSPQAICHGGRVTRYCTSSSHRISLSLISVIRHNKHPDNIGSTFPLSALIWCTAQMPAQHHILVLAASSSSRAG